MGTLLEMVFNKMTVDELEEMNRKGVSFVINDGLIVGSYNEKIPTKPTKAE